MNTSNNKNDSNKYHLYTEDPESLEKDGNAISGYDKLNVSIRLGFIRKVYGILSLQLLLSTFMCLLSMYSQSFFKFQMENAWLIIFSFLVTLILPCLGLCFTDMFRKVPSNYIFLFTFTFFESYIVSCICGMTSPRLVFMAAAMTFGMVLGLTVYASTTKRDLTLQGGFIFILGFSVLLLAIFAMFTTNPFVHILISSLWVFVFGLYLVYDTQLILGNGELKLTVDDYIWASFMLYLDIINLFLNLLQILKIISNDR
jgi:FtsH-binding integral membrane protein